MYTRPSRLKEAQMIQVRGPKVGDGDRKRWLLRPQNWDGPQQKGFM